MDFKVEVQRDSGKGVNRIKVSDAEGFLCGDTGELSSADEDLSCTLKNLYFAIERIADLEAENAKLREQGKAAWQPKICGTTTWEFRFVEALRVLCGNAEPPAALVQEWLSGDGDELQGWVVSNCIFSWAMGASIIDAATTLANEPEEGAGHVLARPQPAAMESNEADKAGGE